MRQGLYVVLDAKMGLYSMPFFSVSDPAAIRSFSDGVIQGSGLLSHHPEDFVLMRLADVEDSTGQVVVPVTPIEVFKGRDVKKENDHVR